LRNSKVSPYITGSKYYARGCVILDISKISYGNPRSMAGKEVELISFSAFGEGRALFRKPPASRKPPAEFPPAQGEVRRKWAGCKRSANERGLTRIGEVNKRKNGKA
jgi:hypothetical protein